MHAVFDAKKNDRGRRYAILRHEYSGFVPNDVRK
jgi:hypothetical protein